MPDEQGLEQLAELVEVLDRSGLTWWVSCGTLLDLVRDGRLKPGKDIDIECWPPRGGWAPLRRELGEAGYRIRPHPYRGKVYKFWLTHGRWSRPVDIDVLRTTGEVAWYPVKAAPSSRLVIRVLRRVWRSTSMLDGPRSLRALAAMGFTVDSVQIPAELVDEFERIEVNGVCVSVPVQREKILRLHYGDWRVPVSDWVMSRDDGTYVHSVPE